MGIHELVTRSRFGPQGAARSSTMSGMSKVITAEYDAAKQVLRLSEPLEGFAHGEKVWLKVVPGAPGELTTIVCRRIPPEESRENFARA
jgi:hypothetical protein